MPNPFRKLPSVSQLLESPPLKSLVETANHSVVVSGVRTFLDKVRDQVSNAAAEIPTPQEMAEKIADWIRSNDRPLLRPVINGTGILLHTGLGRAPLPDVALKAIADIGSGYASVELNLESGKRGKRADVIRKILVELTGAESSTVVNNNAAATMLTLAAMAEGKEVIVSRGELIEIGGSYRLPDVMECSGAKLREVGTTNKTRIADYENAINENTGAILKVHPSNFQVIGFTESVPIADLVQLGHQHRIPVIDDIGSGALLDFGRYGLNDEPVAQESIQAGADIILFSGDKLVGGPQCGIIAGKEKYVTTIESHSMMRAMRVDKITLAALHATLRCYRDVDEAEREIPLLKMLSTPIENLKFRASKLATQLTASSILSTCEIVEECSMLGGGTIPTQKIATWCVGMTPAHGTVDQLAAKLRSGQPSVIGRIQNDHLLLDMRTIEPKYDSILVQMFEEMNKASRDSSPEPVEVTENTTNGEAHSGN